MPEEVTNRLLELDGTWGRFCPVNRWAGADSPPWNPPADDPIGFKGLYWMLRAAMEVRAEYARLGIPEQVYWDTMGCFPRFVREHRDSFGVYGFDRGWWTVRQVTCKLFRVGELEYELTTQKGAPAVSLHIPTDTRLELGLLRQSWLEARQLLGRVFPEYGDAPMVCRSWLLSPTLGELLSPRSNILRFQKSFHITPLPVPSAGVKLWVFKNPNLSLEELPEDTSLQRRLKGYLLGGGTFWDGKGTLSADPFCPER